MMCPYVCWNLLSVFLRTLAAHITHLVRMFKGLFYFFFFLHQTGVHCAVLFPWDSLYNIMWNASIKVSWSIGWLMCIRHHIWCRKNIPHDCFVLVSSCKNHGSTSLAWSYSVLKWRLGRWALTLRFALLSWLVAQTEYVTNFLFQKNKGRIMNTTNLKSVRQCSLNTNKNILRITKSTHNSWDFSPETFFCALLYLQSIENEYNSHIIYYIHLFTRNLSFLNTFKLLHMCTCLGVT